MPPVIHYLFRETSYAGTEKIFQQLQQKDDECRQQLLQISQIQASRDALLEEVKGALRTLCLNWNAIKF